MADAFDDPIADEFARCQSQRKSDNQTYRYQGKRSSDHKGRRLRGSGPERQPHPNLGGVSSDVIGSNSIQPDGSKDERKYPEE